MVDRVPLDTKFLCVARCKRFASLTCKWKALSCVADKRQHHWGRCQQATMNCCVPDLQSHIEFALATSSGGRAYATPAPLAIPCVSRSTSAHRDSPHHHYKSKHSRTLPLCNSISPVTSTVQNHEPNSKQHRINRNHVCQHRSRQEHQLLNEREGS